MKTFFLLCLSKWPVFTHSVKNELRIESHDLLANIAISDKNMKKQFDQIGENMLNLSNPSTKIKLSSDTKQTSRFIDIVVRLTLPPVGKSGAKSKQEREDHKSAILAEQNEAIIRLGKVVPEMKLIAQTQMVMNAIFVKVPTSSLHDLKNDDSVTRIAPVGEYTLDLSETVPFIGGDVVHAKGYNGTGVKVAVVDSGIDYTHKNLGGEGTIEAFEKAYGTNMTDNHTRREGLFPTKKVVEGFDFVGEMWPLNNDTLEPDDDPIDIEGHGTNVADIIAGERGVAPGATLVAIKVCSAVASGCNGIALVQAVEYAIEQEVDIINLSLGSSYGQPFDDDLSYALKGAHDDFGIMVVASAGNCGDNPYCTGTPAAEPTVLSVAQTAMPNWYTPQISVNNNDYLAAFFTWSVAPNQTLSGSLMYADGTYNNTLGCEPFAPGSLDGYIVLVDRGECFFTTKVMNIENAGGIGAIIGNNIPGEKPFAGSSSGDVHPNITVYMISAEDSYKIKQEYSEAKANSTNVTVIFDPSNKIELPSNQTASTSARGPDMSFNRIKPEIGAPGQSLSAIAGSGDKERNFGGTSGAGPMVAGAAALIKQSCPECKPMKIKALLMNTADRNTASDTTGEPAEISRIGAGIVRVDKALTTTMWAYSPDDNQPSLSLGLVDAAADMLISRKVLILNRKGQKQNLKVSPTFRLNEKEQSGAIRIEVRVESQSVGSSIILEENGETQVEIVFRLKADVLPSNFMSSGLHGTDPAALSANEFDGYIVITSSDGGEIALPWHILARKAAKVTADRTTLVPGSFPDIVTIENKGAGVAQIDTFDLLAISDEKKRGSAGEQQPTPDIRAIGYKTTLSQSCQAGFALQFAVNTWERQTHLLPVVYMFDFDVDGDGFYETKMYNQALNGFDDARVATYTVVTPKSIENNGTATQSFSDEESYSPVANFFVSHSTNTGNTVLSICGEQLGLNMMDLLSQNIVINGKASSIDYFNGGPGDEVANFTITPFGERFTTIPGIGLARQRNATEMNLETGEVGELNVYDMGTPHFLNTTSYGMMIITNGYRGDGNTGAATEDTEMLLFLTPGVEGPKPLVVIGSQVDDENSSGLTKSSPSQSRSRGDTKSSSSLDSKSRSISSSSSSDSKSKTSKSGSRVRRGRNLRGSTEHW